MSINATKRKTVSKYKISQNITPVKRWMNQGPFGNSNKEVSSLASGFSINDKASSACVPKITLS